MKLTNKNIKELGFVEEDGVFYLEIMNNVILSLHSNKPTNCYHFYINNYQPGNLITNIEEIFTVLSRHMIGEGKKIKIEEFKKVLSV